MEGLEHVSEAPSEEIVREMVERWKHATSETEVSPSVGRISC
jgi:hypothetical protein